MIKKLLWWLKQILPLTYVSKYANEDGKHELAVWKMWFGRCYHEQVFKLAD